MTEQETEDLLGQDMRNIKTMQQLEYFQNKDRQIKGKQNYSSVQNMKRILDYQDYQKYVNERNEKAKKVKIELSSEQLKEDYNITLKYLYSNLTKLMIITILSTIFSIVCFRTFGVSENLVYLSISSIISLLLIIFLFMFLYLGSLVDIYNHKVFYGISMVEAINAIFSLLLCIMNIPITYAKLTCKGRKCKKIRIPSKFILYILGGCNVLIIIGFLVNIKFLYALLAEGFNIFTKREKTIIQKQFEINERKKKIEKKEEKKQEKKEEKNEKKKEATKNKKKHKN